MSIINSALLSIIMLAVGQLKINTRYRDQEHKAHKRHRGAAATTCFCIYVCLSMTRHDMTGYDMSLYMKCDVMCCDVMRCDVMRYDIGGSG